ncbi:MAG: minor capsid protein [Verrucomicrobiota bacterium]|nr:minor capsid protein [Verrucomicrobiota bacterium]
MIKHFILWLADVSGLEVGADLFLDRFPQDAPDNAVLVAERISASVDPYNATRRDHRIQIVVRGQSMIAARSDAEAVFARMVNLRNLSLADYATTGEGQFSIYVSTDCQAPAYIGQDEKKRFIYSGNVTLKVKEEN